MLAALLKGFNFFIKRDTQAREAGDFMDYENDYEDEEYDDEEEDYGYDENFFGPGNRNGTSNVGDYNYLNNLRR